MIRSLACWAPPWLALAVVVSASEGPKTQDEALALLAKIDGKVKFDPEHPKRVIGIDI